MVEAVTHSHVGDASESCCRDLKKERTKINTGNSVCMFTSVFVCVCVCVCLCVCVCALPFAQGAVTLVSN